jgi:hypothetical protein
MIEREGAAYEKDEPAQEYDRAFEAAAQRPGQGQQSQETRQRERNALVETERAGLQTEADFGDVGERERADAQAQNGQRNEAGETDATDKRCHAASLADDAGNDQTRHKT